MSEVNVGDCVVIKSVASRCAAKYVNLIGTVVTLLPSGRPIVETAGPNPTRVIATAVERVGEFSVGDRVVIRAVRNVSLSGRLVGRTGKVVYAFQSRALQGHYTVETEGTQETTIATSVEKVDDVVRPTSRPLTASEHALYASENHSWQDEVSELLRRRTQAAEFAHRILGADADLEDLIGLADWILDNPAASPQEAKQRYVFNPGGVLPSAHNAEIIESMRESLARSRFFSTTNATDPIPTPEPTPTRVPADLETADEDGDRVKLSYREDGPGYPSRVVALLSVYPCEGDVQSAYVTADDADRIIAFLQDAKAAKA